MLGGIQELFLFSVSLVDQIVSEAINHLVSVFHLFVRVANIFTGGLLTLYWNLLEQLNNGVGSGTTTDFTPSSPPTTSASTSNTNAYHQAILDGSKSQDDLRYVKSLLYRLVVLVL